MTAAQIAGGLAVDGYGVALRADLAGDADVAQDYWQVLDPILKGWLADGIESLREITQDDIKRAIATRKGTPARSIPIILRNVFRALRQEGVIFRDPTRGLVFAGINKPPPSVPSDRLAGVLSPRAERLPAFGDGAGLRPRAQRYRHAPPAAHRPRPVP